MNFTPGNLVGQLDEPHDSQFVGHVVRGVLAELASYHHAGRSFGQVRADTVYMSADGRIRLGDVRATIVSTQVEAPEGLSKYLPPETLAAETFGEVGPATDLYALGMLAVELLTGPRFAALFEGVADDPLGGDLAWMRWHGEIEKRLPPVREIVPGVDASLAAAIDQMTAKRVADRPANAQAVLTMLDQPAGEAPAAASPPVAPPPPTPVPSKTVMEPAKTLVEPPTPPSEPPRVEPPASEPTAGDSSRATGQRDESAEDATRRTSEAGTAATIYFDESGEPESPSQGLAPLEGWQDDLRKDDGRKDDIRKTPRDSTLADIPLAALEQERRLGERPTPRDEPPTDVRAPAASPIRGTMMPDEAMLDEAMSGAGSMAADQSADATTAPAASDVARRAAPPEPELPPAMRLVKKRYGPLDHPVTLAALSLAIIAGVAYLLFYAWPVDDGTRTVEIKSHPSGARVTIDGVARDEKTPAKLKLKIGKHEIAAVLDGYDETMQSIDVAKQDESREVVLELKKTPTARLVHIATTPSDAVVYLDGNPVQLGPRTPAEVTLSFGRHTLLVKKAGFVDATVDIDVSRGDGPQLEKITLLPVPKRIEDVVVKVDPADATITAGGKPVAATMGQATMPVEEGASVDLVVSAAGYADWRKTLSFDELKATQFTVVADLNPIVAFDPPEAAVTVNGDPLLLDGGRTEFPPSPDRNYHIVATAKGYKDLDVTVSRAELVERKFRFALSAGPHPPATLRQVAGGRYVHDALDKAGAPLYFVVVEPGEFVFGAARDGIRNGELERRREVIATPYLISTTEVSVRQYAIFAAAEGEAKAGTRWRPSDVDAAAKLPVTNVSHQQAKNFAAFVGGALPTEKQWERAARGTDGRTYPWPERDEPSKDRCNLGFTTGGQLMPVDALPDGATPEGVLNMLGNAAEWCADLYEPGHRDIDDQTPGIRQFPTIRGGSYLDPYNSTTRNARATMRANADPARGGRDIGFRMVVPFVDGE